MKFSTAKRKLEKIAEKKYHTISYQYTKYASSRAEIECCLYIEGHDHCPGQTWKEAFKKLDKNINPPKKRKLKKEESPDH